MFRSTHMSFGEFAMLSCLVGMGNVKDKLSFVDNTGAVDECGFTKTQASQLFWNFTQVKLKYTLLYCTYTHDILLECTVLYVHTVNTENK